MWLITICTALSLFGDSALYVVLPSQFERFGLVILNVGWLLSVNRLVRLPLNVPSSWLARRFGPKWPFVVGLVCGAISTMGFGLLRSFWALLALRCLWGVAWALIVVASYAFVLEAAGSTKRGRFTGIYMSFSRFGGAVGAMLGGALLDTLGVRVSMTVLASCGGLAAVLALLLPNTGRAIQTAGLSLPEVTKTGSRSTRWARQLRAVDPALWLVFLFNFAHLLVFGGVFYSTFGHYLRMVAGDSIAIGGLVIGVASLTGALLFARNILGLVGSPLVGAISDRSGRRARALLLAELFGALSLVLLAIDRSAPTVVIGILVASVSYGIAPGLLLAWLGDLSSGRPGLAVGGFQTAGDLGSGLGPLIAYPLVAWLGVRGVYALAAGVIAMAALAALAFSRKHLGSPRGLPQ